MHPALLAWLVVTNVLAFVPFAWDKFRASRSSPSRVSEFHLVAIAAVAGWPGGLLGMLLFKRKTAKLSFKLKYALGFVVWAGLLYAAWFCL